MTDRFEIIGDTAPFFIHDKTMPANTRLAVMLNTRGEAEAFKVKLEMIAQIKKPTRARLTLALCAIVPLHFLGYALVVVWAPIYAVSALLEVAIKTCSIISQRALRWALNIK